MITYSNDKVSNIFTDIKFLETYKLYNDVHDFHNFLNSIEFNKDYYKIKLSTKYDHSNNNKMLQKSIEYLNKITKDNYIQITDNIYELINDDIVNEYCKYVIEKIILHEIFSNEYIFLLKKLCDKYNNHDSLNIYINKLYDTIIKKNNNTNDYEKLCSHNKLLDNLIGYYRMIIQINSLGIYNDINKITIDIIEQIKTSDDDTQYKYLQCLMSIIKTDITLINMVDDDLSNFLKTKKNKFLLMDIYDLQN